MLIKGKQQRENSRGEERKEPKNASVSKNLLKISARA